MTIQIFKNVEDYLTSSLQFLEQREIENNITIGICTNLSLKKTEKSSTIFINVLEENKIIVSSILTSTKLLISSIENSNESTRLIVEYLKDNHIKVPGVFVETKHACYFENAYLDKLTTKKELMVHQLINIEEQQLADGTFNLANLEDIEILSAFRFNFQEETKTLPNYSRLEINDICYSLIKNNLFYTWKVNGVIVSCSAMIRSTKNIGVVGIVYTPPALRGKGYARSCVQELSKHILRNGFSSCGLFTDQSNPISNHLYKSIGYKPIASFCDIEFL